MSAAATFKCSGCGTPTLIKALFLGLNNEPICAICYKATVPQGVRDQDNLNPVLEEPKCV